jgi:hypothetical protein
MGLGVERIMEALRALAKDTTRRESQRFVAAEQAIKTWLAQTSDPTERQAKPHIEQQLNTIAIAGHRP